MAETKYEARLKTLYSKEIAKKLQKELTQETFGLDNFAIIKSTYCAG